MSISWPDKDPDDKLDYEVNWADFLGIDTIATSNFFASPDDIIINSPGIDPGGKKTTLVLEGGTAGTTYIITNRITTLQGLQKDEDVHIYVTDDTDLTELEPEDGTGKPDADSYASLDEITTIVQNGPYAEDWEPLNVEQKVAIIRNATALIDISYRFYGQTMTTTQALQWPRTKNYDNNGVIIPPGTIPRQLILALGEISGAIANDSELLELVTSGEGAVKSWSTEGLSISFDQGSPSSSAAGTGGTNGAAYLLGPRFPRVELNLRSLGTLKTVDWLQNDKTTVSRQ